jgi:predicted aldo/keto reductase-like oxidoreductase
MVLSGMSNMEQMVDNVKTFDAPKPLTESENALLMDIAEALKNAVPCTACRYCCDGCPMGLDIPALLAIYNDLKVTPSFLLGMRVEALPPEKRPDACIGCGACYDHCAEQSIERTEDGKYRIRPMDCDDCGICYTKCPLAGKAMICRLTDE